MVGERTLIDTNVLVYALYTDSPYHGASQSLLTEAMDPGAGYFVTPQNLLELFAVITNPRRVTSAYSTTEAITVIESVLSRPGMHLLPPIPDVLSGCLNLLRGRQVIGRRVFDVQLVATMLGHGIRKICTFNASDFELFEEIEVRIPSDAPRH